MPEIDAASGNSHERKPRAFSETIYRWIPAIDSLRDYSLTYFRRDFIAGITVAAVAVPQAMAYAQIFGMPPQYGLYTAIVMTGVGALFDSSKQLINGPTNAISIALLSAMAIIPEESRITAAFLMAFLIGSIQTGITLLRLGDLSRYISHAVVVGFTAGASILLVLDQLKNLLGLKAMGDHHDHFLKRFWLTMTEGGSIHYPTLGVALLTITVALVLRWVNKRFRLGFPELLMAIAVAATAVWFLKLNEKGVSLIPKIPSSLPGFQIPTFDWGMSRELISSATAIALLGLLEAIAMAKSIAAKTRQKLDINQQCLSEGVANLAGSFFQCFPGSGSLTRSYINHQAGAATQWSGVICAIAVALTVVLFAPLAQFIPKAALAGVLMLAATRMIDMTGILYHVKTTRFDAAIVLTTALSAVLVSVEFCILIGVLLSFLIYVPRAARVELNELKLTDEGTIRELTTGESVDCHRLKLYNFEGELFFGSSPDFEMLLERIEAELREETRVIILRIKHLRNPDAVCLEILDRFIDRLNARNVLLAMSGVREEFFKTLVRSGIVRKLGVSRVFRENSQLWTSTNSAIEWGYQQLHDHCETCPRSKSSDGNNWHFVI